MEKQLIVNVSPHIHSKDTTQTIMRDVIISLMPALVAAVIIYGFRALYLTAVCVATAIASEYIYEKITKRPITTWDLSAVVTGLLLAYSIPVGLPIWIAVLGSAIAIIIVKQLFGGIGHNFANPAVTARIILFLSFASYMTDWSKDYPDALAGATPLATGTASYTDLFLGNISGCLGEGCTLALLIGGVYLLVRKVITWHTPVCFIGGVFVFSFLFGQDPVYAILSGGVVIGAFFMATDYATTPTLPLGKVIFGLGCALITCVIRAYCSYPEGVSFAILLMNILTPHIDRLVCSKAFGGVKA